MVAAITPMLEGVTIEQLRTLRAVAEAGSFSAAARQLGRVQAAVSQSIDRLEAQLGLTLFDRTGRTPRLTPQGEAVVAAAARVHGEVESLDALVARLRAGAETTLSIVVDSMFPTASLVDFARELTREHPGVELVVHTESLSAVTSHVRARRAAWGVAGEDADLTGLDRRRIADLRLVAVAAPSHPLASVRGAVGAEALATHVQVVLSERRHEGLRPSADHGVLSTKTWRVVDLATKHDLIAAGLGWGHMPEHLVRDDLRAGRLVSLHLDAWGGTQPTRALVLAWRRGAVGGPVAQWAMARIASLCLVALDHPT